MLFLQHSQSTSPVTPQPLQEWGKSKSKGLGYVVFFTIKLMIFLILLQNWFIIKHNNISGGNMARTNSEDLLDDDLAAAFLSEEEGSAVVPETTEKVAQELTEEINSEPATEDEWANDTDDFPGQLAVDVYETADKLVVKARTAGISKSDLDVSIADNILTISGVLSGGEDEQTTRWHIQECYWGEFSRMIALPVQVREDENSVKAELKDGVLTITFEKEKVEAPKKIAIQ
jgi:HSP20 family protein